MFAEYLGFLSTNRDGISVFFAGAFFFVVLLQWLFWIFGVGRFKGHEVSRNLNLRYIFSDAAVKIESTMPNVDLDIWNVHVGC